MLLVPELFGLLVLFGVELEFGEVEFISLELELEEEPGLVSELLEPELPDGEVVEDGELDVLDPPWLLEVEGVLWALPVPLPAPLPSFPPAAVPLLLLLWATAMPVEKITAVASVRNLLRISVVSPWALFSVFSTLDANPRRSLPQFEGS